MSGIYGFRGGPSLATRPIEDDFAAMMDEPMSLGSTFWDQTKGGVLESFGLGTAIRTVTLPPAASTRRGRETDAEYQARQERVKGITEDEYKSSPYFREDVPWDAGMTADRAAALATMYDAKRVRQYFAEKRPFTAFLGGMAGQATDPINYIPIAGPAVRAAAIAKFGTVKGIAATAALDAAANTALAGLVTRETRASFGDDVSWQTMVTEMATAALIGSAFGTVGGLLERRAGVRAEALRRDAEAKVQSLRAVQESRIALNEAIGGLANDGEVRLSPNATGPIERMVGETSGGFAGRDFSKPVVELPEFKAWFGDSKIVSPEGEPLVVYHGTKSDFEAFDASLQGQSDFGASGRGFYFSQDPGTANVYAQLAPVGESPQIYPVYLSMENPFEMQGAIWPNSAEESALFTQRIRDAGHDGIVVKADDGSITEAVVFEPGQVKSVFNRGTFSRSDPRIIDASPARPDPIPEGKAEAEASLTKREDYKALAEQYRVDPETGAFDEEADIRRLVAEGKLTDDDVAALESADTEYQDGAAYGEALKSVVACVL